MDEELKAIVQRMIDAKESEANIALVIQGWKPKKQNEVSTQGSKNTSKTSTEPLPTSQKSNPFGLNTTVPTIDVATGKTGATKVNAMNTRIAKVEKKGTDVKNTLGASLNDLYAGLTKTPRYVYDLFSAPQNFLAEQFNIPDLATNYDNFLRLTDRASAGLGQIRSPLSALDGLGDYYEGNAQGFKDKQIRYEKGIFDSLKDGDFSNAGSQLVNQIVGSAPSIALMAGTSGVGSVSKLGGVSKTLLNALPFASSKSNEIRDNTEIPEYLKPIISAGYGLSEVVFDQKFGTQAIINRITDKFKNEGAEVALDEAKKFATGYLTKALKGIKEPLSDLGKNALEEMTTQFSQNLIDKITVDPNKDLTEGLADAGLVGGAMGGGISAIGALVNSKSKAKIAEKTKAIQELTADLDTDIPEETKQTLLSQVGKLKREINTEITKADEQFEALDEDSKEKVIEISSKIDGIEKSLAVEGITPTTKATLEEQKLKLEEQLAEIKPVAEVKIESDITTPQEEVKVTESVKTTPIEEITDEEYSIFVDKGIVDEKTLKSISNKVKNNETLSKRETAIFTDKTSEINKIIANEGTTEGAKVPEYFNVYEDVVKESKTKEEAFAKITESGAILSDTFNKKYNPDGKLTPQETFDKFYEEIKKQEETQNATNQGKIEQGSVEERIGTIEQQQGQQENRQYQEKPIPTTKTETSGSDSVKQGGTNQEVVPKPKFTIKGETVTPKAKEVAVEEPKVSGIKKALVSQDRIDSVDFEKITDKEMQDLGKSFIENGEVKPKEVVDSISGGDRRALQPKEVVSLIQYKAELDNTERELYKQKNELLAKGESTTAIDAQLNDVQQDIISFDTTAVITAQQQSLAFRLRKGLLDKDYNYVTQVEKYKATNGGVITPEVEAKFKEYDAELKQLKEQILQAEEKARVAQEQTAVDSIVEDVKKKQTQTATKRKRAEANLQKAKDDFSIFIKRSRGQANSFADVATFVKQASKLVKAYAELGILKGRQQRYRLC